MTMDNGLEGDLFNPDTQHICPICDKILVFKEAIKDRDIYRCPTCIYSTEVIKDDR